MNLIAKKLYNKGFDAIAVDLTTKETKKYNKYVYKVVIPGLIKLNSQYLYRFLGGKRILNLKQKLGYSSKKLTIKDLNQYPHPMA